MAGFRLVVTGDVVLCRSGSGIVRKPLDAAVVARAARWAANYAAAVRARAPERLPVIGREMAAWLDDGDGWLSTQIARPGPVSLEIEAGDESPAVRTLLAAPWELLAPDGVFLAAKPTRLFLVARRLGAPEPAEAPVHGDLALLFLTADDEGQHSLDYEREEAAFLAATDGLNAHVAIEESGSAAGLGRRLARSARWEALHLTCHGDHGPSGPVLALESEEGSLHRTGDIIR